MNTIDGMIKDLESDETVIGGCTTAGEIIIALKSSKERKKKGKWIEHPHEAGENWEYSKYECSKCHVWTNDDSDFCPNCGAEMENEE